MLLNAIAAPDRDGFNAMPYAGSSAPAAAPQCLIAKSLTLWRMFLGS